MVKISRRVANTYFSRIYFSKVVIIISYLLLLKSTVVFCFLYVNCKLEIGSLGKKIEVWMHVPRML